MSDPDQTPTRIDLRAQRPVAADHCPTCGQPLPRTTARATALPWPALSVRAREELAPIGERVRALAPALGLALARVRVRVRLAYTATVAWSRAGRELLRARRRQQRLHDERRARVASLGEAVLRGDYSRAASLKSTVRELGAEMQAHDHYAETALDIARDRIAREWAAQERVSHPR
jgi:hypothetical protein